MKKKYSILNRLIKENVLEDTPEEVIDAAEEEEGIPAIDDLTFWTVVQSVDPDIVDAEAPQEIQDQIDEQSAENAGEEL